LRVLAPRKRIERKAPAPGPQCQGFVSWPRAGGPQLFTQVSHVENYIRRRRMDQGD
jgi:hypothetical protein